jgi:hypothetical protein
MAIKLSKTISFDNISVWDREVQSHLRELPRESLSIADSTSICNQCVLEITQQLIYMDYSRCSTLNISNATFDHIDEECQDEIRTMIDIICRMTVHDSSRIRIALELYNDFTLSLSYNNIVDNLN